MKTWSDTDSLYGTRHLAEKWEKDGTLKENQGAHGDGHDRIPPTLPFDRDTNTTPWLLDLIYSAAERGGYQSHFYALRSRHRRRSHALRQTRRPLCRCN